MSGRSWRIMRHGQLPESRLPDDWRNAVLHARIEIGNTVLVGADIPGAEPVRSAYLTLTLDSAGEAERIYGLLSEGGPIRVPIRPAARPLRHVVDAAA